MSQSNRAASASAGPSPPAPGESLLVWLATTALPHFISIPRRKSVGFTRGILFGFILGTIFGFAVLTFVFWLIGQVAHTVWTGR